MKVRGGWLLPLLLAAGCAKGIDEGQAIKEIAASEDKPAPDLPVVPSEQVRPDLNLALENYEKLLDLPQEPAARAETMRRLADLQLELDEQGGGTLAQSDERLRRSVALYNAVLTERPDAPTNDRVLYQLARAYTSLGELAKAEEALLRLTQDYPRSAYIDDARFRRGELLFRLSQFDDAAAEYRQVLALGPGSPFFETAQYKFGWSEYKQSNYESALDVFFDILARELPPGELTDPDAAFEAVRAGKKDMARDALRVISLSFTQLGGPDAAARYFAAKGQPPFVALVYSALGEHLLEKKRYTDSAKTYAAFIDAHPRHPLAPRFLGTGIKALEAGGFVDLVVSEKERYARHLDPAAPYWAGATPPSEVMQELRRHLEDLGRHYQASGQRLREREPAQARTQFDAAAKWYRRLLEIYPQDPEAAELRFLLAESLFDAGATLAAAAEYEQVVAQHPGYDKAPEAAYAALLAYQRRATEVPEAERAAALRRSVQAGLTLAERFPRHPQALAALTRAAEDLYRLQDFDRAVDVAGQVLRAQPAAPDALRRTAWGVTADAHFSAKRFAQAEDAYGELLKLVPVDAPERAAFGERLASSIYKQGEAARTAGDPKAAAEAFLRVGRVAPAASIRATADYDASAMLIAAADWTQAAAVLEAFRTAHPASKLLPEVDKKLSVVYQNAGRPKDAAAALERIAANAAETPDTRRDAAWLALTLREQARDPQLAARYEAYVNDYPRPLERAIEARQKLAELASARGQEGQQHHWLREIINADAAADAERTDRTRQLAAEATLALGRAEMRKAARVALKLPLGQSVPLKKAATERALETLSQAIDYGIADVATAATYELGVLYEDFSKALLASDRPRKMSALEREQYDLLLEEQAFPFEEKAMQYHETNLQRVTGGLYTPWIGKSLAALARLAPGRYGKREQMTEVYDAR